MANVVIYPQGNVGNTDPHMLFDDGTIKLQFNIKDKYLSLSSSTVSDGVNIGPQNVIASGVTVGNGYSLYIGGIRMVDSSAIWVGPTAGIKGNQGAQGAQGGQGAQGTIGAQGATGAQGSTNSVVGAQGATGNGGARPPH